MGELDQETTRRAPAPARDTGPDAGGSSPLSIVIIGDGRAGNTFASGLSVAGHEVIGPLGRGDGIPAGADVALLCVPDAAIAEVAPMVPAGTIVAHCCGAHGSAILGDRSAFTLHPLMTLTGDHLALLGAFAAVDASEPTSLDTARRLAADLGMHVIDIDPTDRVAYHAAAAMASNFLVTLEGAAETLAATVGVPREALLPLVRQTVENWGRLGAAGSLTGPVARGDAGTVSRHRAAIAERAPELLPLFDEMCAATDRLAREGAER